MTRKADAAARGEILIVEDTPASMQLLADLMSQAGYGVRCAQEGGMALISARAAPPDLVLLDVCMPGMDGYEVCRRLKSDARTRDIPVIFLSALRETEDKVRGFRAGGVDYIAKPYQADEVLARARAHLELHRLQAALEARVEERTAQLQAAKRRIEESEARLRELAGFLQTVREEERARIARELHDELGQGLTALRIDLGWLRGKCGRLGAAAAERIAGALGVVEHSVAALRRISEDLRPAMLDSLGLAAAVEDHVAKFSTRTGIACHLSMNREEFDLDDRVATAVFRVVQEALTNVARHAQASELEVSIEECEQGGQGGIRLSVRDNGRGLPAVPEHKTFGLLGMRERVSMLGGRLDIESEPGRGTRIGAWLPLREAPAA
ncbi:MAG: hypothetical protein Fur0039_08450 [Rhodocyclaceae bacterium]